MSFKSTAIVMGMNADWLYLLGMNADWLYLLGMNADWFYLLGMNADWFYLLVYSISPRTLPHSPPKVAFFNPIINLSIGYAA